MAGLITSERVIRYLKELAAMLETDDFTRLLVAEHLRRMSAAMEKERLAKECLKELENDVRTGE